MRSLLLKTAALFGTLLVCHALHKPFNPSQMPVTEVTVYPGLAQIIRSVEWADPQPGEHVIELRGLPEELDDATLFVKASDAVELLDTTISTRLSRDEEEAHQALIQPLQDQLRAIETRIVEKAQETKQMEEKIALTSRFSKSVIDSSSGKDQQAMFVGFKELLQFNDDILGEAFKTLAKLENDRAELQLEASRIRAQIPSKTEFSAAHPNRTVKDVTLRIRLADASSTPLKFEVAYHQHGCSWTAEYEVKAESPLSNQSQMPVTIKYFARVIQRTREDWSNVKLTLGTIPPQLASLPPVLRPLRATNSPAFDPFNNVYAKFSRAGGAAMPEMAAMRTPLSDVVQDSAEVTDLGVLGSYAFTIKQRVNIASSRSQVTKGRTFRSENGVRVLIDTIALQGQPFLWVAPAETTTAYFQLLCTNTRSLPLIPSQQVTVYLDGNMITRSSIPETAPGELFAINLGEDRGVKVTHRPLKITDNSEGIIAKSKVRPYDTLTTVTNQNNRPTMVVVGQVVPKPEHNKIQVEMLKPTIDQLQPLAAKKSRSNQDELKNILDKVGGNRDKVNPSMFISKASNTVYWAMVVSPTETVNIPLEYKISWPQSEGDLYVEPDRRS